MVILLAGAAGSGKTTLAAQLAAGGAVLAPDCLIPQEPAHQLVRLGYGKASDPAEALRQAASVARPLLELFVADAVAAGRDLIVETARLEPEAALALAHWHEGQVRSLFLVEEDATSVYLHLARHYPVFTTFAPSKRDQVVAAQLRYGQWLAQEARRLGLPVAAPRPWQDLAARARRALALVHHDSRPRARTRVTATV